MSLRKVLLVGGILCAAGSAVSADVSGSLFLFKAGSLEKVSDRSSRCAGNCIFYPTSTSVARYEATRIEKIPFSDVVRLEGKVRVIFTDGTEVQAEKLSITKLSNGKEQLDGREVLLVNPQK